MNCLIDVIISTGLFQRTFGSLKVQLITNFSCKAIFEFKLCFVTEKPYTFNKYSGILIHRTGSRPLGVLIGDGVINVKKRFFF